LFEPSGALLTNGPTGLFRWPVFEDPAAVGEWRIGPPEKLPLPGSDCAFDLSPDGRILAMADHTGGVGLHSHRPGHPVQLKPHGDARYISVSPDGRRVATGSHGGTDVKIWNAQTGELEKVLPIDWISDVAFSPDGKWLATNEGGVRLWTIDGWRPGPVV